MITVDCGISGVEEAVVARQCGLELIITDHHTLGPQLPERRPSSIRSCPATIPSAG